jgi:aldehyde:ferredoxin oxidoreductase
MDLLVTNFLAKKHFEKNKNCFRCGVVCNTNAAFQLFLRKRNPGVLPKHMKYASGAKSKDTLEYQCPHA